MLGMAAFLLGYVMSQLYRSFLAVFAPLLSNELAMSEADLAFASGAWFVAFAVAQFPVGYLLDTIGPRKTVGWISGVFAGGGAVLFAVANSGFLIIVAMGLIGIGCAPLLMGPFFIFARRYSPAIFATYASSFVAFGTLGNVFSSEPMVILESYIGWRAVMVGLAVVSLVAAIAVLWAVVDPEKMEGELQANGKKEGFLTVLKIPGLWFVYPSILFSYAVSGGVRGLWVGPYLENVFDLTSFEIGRATLFMAIALVAGSLVFGPLDRIFNSRKWVVFWGNAFVLGICLYMAISVPPSVFVANLCFIGIGFFGASYAVQMAHGKAFVPEHLTGRGVTLLNFCSIGGVGLMQVISGKFVEYSADPTQPVVGYQALFWLYTVTLAVAMVIYLFSSDKKPSDA